MIYGRTGCKVEIVRMGTLDDVKTLDKRKADKQDRECVERGSYVVVRYLDDKFKDCPSLYDVSYLRADGGIKEIYAAIEAIKVKV